MSVSKRHCCPSRQTNSRLGLRPATKTQKSVTPKPIHKEVESKRLPG